MGWREVTQDSSEVIAVMLPRVLRLTLVVVLIALAMPAGCARPRPPAPPEPATVPPAEPQLADIVAETVLEAPVGEGSGELAAIFPENAMDRIPAAFAVTRDAVLILDTLNSRVLEYRGGRPARAVPFPEVIEGTSLAVDRRGDWYIYDPVSGSVLQASPAGEVKGRWVVPERSRQGLLLLKQGSDGDVVLAVCNAQFGEYGLAEPLAGPTPGLSFPGHTERYTVKGLGSATRVVCVDGEDKWRLAAPNGLSGASLVGFDGRGCLIAEGAEFSRERSALIFALHPGGGVTWGILDVSAFRSVPEHCHVVGEDGQLYFLAFTEEKGVVQRLSLKPR